jgi:hypothetical protein
LANYLPLVLAALTIGEGGGLGRLFGKLLGNGDEDDWGGGLKSILVPVILLSLFGGASGASIMGAAPVTGTTGGTSTVTNPPAAAGIAGLANYLPLVLAALAIGDSEGARGLFRKLLDDGDEDDGGGGLKSILVPVILLWLFGGASGASVLSAAPATGTTTPTSAPPASSVAGLANNLPALLLAAALGGRRGLGEFFGQS